LIVCLLLAALPLHGEEIAFPAKNNEKQDLHGHPAARLLSEEFSSEHWEFTARFDSGHLIFIHFLVTNIGWGDRNAVVIGHVITPEGEVRQFGNARSKNKWQLSADRLRFEIGSNVLDMHGPQYHLQVNKKKIRLNLHFQADTPVVWSEALARSGYALDLLATAVPVDGTLWIAEMTEPLSVHGKLAATHSWMRETGGSILVRRMEFFTLREDLPIYGVELTTPHNTPSRWLVIKQPGKPEFMTDTFEWILTKDQALKEFPQYTIPSEIRLQSPCFNGQFNLTRILLRHDPFAKLSTPLRFLASTLLNLHPLQVWVASPFALVLSPFSTFTPLPSEVSTRALAEQGTGIVAITFLNPLPEK